MVTPTPAVNAAAQPNRGDGDRTEGPNHPSSGGGADADAVLQHLFAIVQGIF